MIGRTIGHYRIESKLGEGGMGVVYKAEDVHLSRPVALKFLHSSTDAARLLGEATAAGAISHPNICIVYEADPELAFIAMEYIDGRTLKSRIDNRPLPAGEAMRIALAIGEGLRAAHTKGIIHRDIKSANVMVSESGEVKVMDFGLARSTAGADATREGYSSGTPGYMAPEQERGEPLDRRADIWAFGAVLHEMLTGRLPTGGIGMLPADLDTVVRKALAPEREKRYQHIEDALVDLRRVHAPKHAAKQGRPRMTAAVSTVACLAIAAAAWLWYSRWPPSPAPEMLLAEPLTSYPGNENFPSISPDGTQVAFLWNRERDRGVYIKQIGVEEPFPLSPSREDGLCPIWSPDGSRIAFIRPLAEDRHHVLVVPQRGGPERIVAELGDPPPGTQTNPSLAWSADGRFVVDSASEKWPEVAALYSLSLDTGEKRRLTSPPPNIAGDTGPVISPDGRTLAFVRAETDLRSDLYVMPLGAGFRPAGDPVKLNGPHPRNARPSWTPDGKELIFDASESVGTPSLWRMAPTPGARAQPVKVVTRNAFFPRISSRGNRMVYVTRTTDRSIWKVSLDDTGSKPRRPARFIESTRDDSEPDYSPDGKRLAFVSSRSGAAQIWLSDHDGSHPVQLTSFRDAQVDKPRWSPDGRHVAFHSDAKGSRDIFVATIGGEIKQVVDHPAKDVNPHWSRDGRWIYFLSERDSRLQRTWRIPAGGGDAAPMEGVVDVLQESTDGKWHYHAKGFPLDYALWRSPSGGGEATRYVDKLRTAGGWRVFHDGVYFVGPMNEDGSCPIQFKNFRTGIVETLALTSGPTGTGLAISPDRKTLLFAQVDAAGMDLMLVENFK